MFCNFFRGFKYIYLYTLHEADQRLKIMPPKRMPEVYAYKCRLIGMDGLLSNPNHKTARRVSKATPTGMPTSNILAVGRHCLQDDLGVLQGCKYEIQGFIPPPKRMLLLGVETWIGKIEQQFEGLQRARSLRVGFEDCRNHPPLQTVSVFDVASCERCSLVGGVV